MHREKQNTIFNNIFLLWSMRLLGAVAVMFFGQKVFKNLLHCNILDVFFSRSSQEDESAVYNETCFLCYISAWYGWRPPGTARISFENKMAAPKICFWAICDKTSFAYRRETVTLILISLVSFFRRTREKAINYLELLSNEISLKTMGDAVKTSRNKRMLM